MTKAVIGKTLSYAFLLLFALLMIYPLLWLFFSSFKSDIEIFASTSLLPESWSFSSYTQGWSVMSGLYTYSLFYLNTFRLVIPTVIFTILSSILVAYGFARYQFPLKNVMFMLVLSGLLLPQEILMVPRYMMFRSLGWIDSYLPFIIPAMFATYPFFIYMFIQFFRGIPKELDESARIDGCNSIGVLTRIIIPNAKPAIFTATIFQFLWRWNDFYNPLIYISSVRKYPVALILRTYLDQSDRIFWNRVLAMSMLSMVPCIIIFALFQRYIVEGVVTTGIKG